MSSHGPVALGHRRLAIIDISDEAAQPMASPDGSLWLVFNGEIYNYRELRRELEAAGHHFQSRSDSEVLLTAYREWGEECLNRLIGMFAFIVWDERRQSAFAARDRFGIKPLYVLSGVKGVAFASEIKQLRGLPGEQGRINLPRVHDFLASGLTDHTSETLFEGIRQLRGGECVTLDLARWRPGEALPVRRWYAPPQPGTVDLDEAAAAERFRELLTDSVRLHLRADVPLGSCLSGGLDSSSLVCLMDMFLRADGSDRPVDTFSACYPGKAVDERPFMEAVVSATHSRPHWVHPPAEDAFDLAGRITWHQDEPYGSTSIFAQWSVFQDAGAGGIKVMLDGQGADEQLAGYHPAFAFYHADLLRRGNLLALMEALRARQAVHGVGMAAQIRALLPAMIPVPLANHLRRRRDVSRRHDWLASEAFATTSGGTAFDAALAAMGLGPVLDLGELCVALTFGANLGMLLHWEDRNSMAHGVEARVPFLDHRLVEFTLGLGSRHKIVMADTKRVMRRAMTGILPEMVVNRADKLGFATPEEVWFRGPLRPAVEAGVEETLEYFPGLLNAAGVRALTADILDGRRPFDFLVWRLVNLGVWGRTFSLSA